MITPELLTVGFGDRERYIIQRAAAGVPLARIGREVGISRQRVHAILRQLHARLARRTAPARLPAAADGQQEE